MSDLLRNPLSTPAFWARLQRRIAQEVRRVARPVRGVLESLNAAKQAPLAGIQARAGETVPDVELAQHFGFASRPPAGGEVIAIPIGGSSAHLVVVAELDRAFRPAALGDGEACLYTSAGIQVLCKPDGTVQILLGGNPQVEVTPAGLVKLAGGGAGVARIGDAVTITGATFDPDGGMITATGTISGGSTLVQAGG